MTGNLLGDVVQVDQRDRITSKHGVKEDLRKGDRDWGRKMQRKRASRAQKAHYPGLVSLWAENAWRTRWSYPRVPVPNVGGRWRERESAAAESGAQ